jgi:hypothetical protein
MGWIRKLFTKDKKMSLKEKSYEEIVEFLQDKDFQWLKGEQMGNIEKYKSVEADEATGMVFVNFRSGGRMNVELIQDYLDVFPSTGSNFDLQEFVEPTPVAITSTKKQQPINNSRSQAKNSVSSIELEDSPIYTLLKKQKPNWVSVNISLKLNLPTKNLYGILTSSFEDAETEVINYVTEGIDIEDIRAALSESILSYYDKKKTNMVSTEKHNHSDLDGE